MHNLNRDGVADVAPLFESLEPRQLASATVLASRAANPTVTVDDVSVVEGTGGSTVLSFVFTRRGTAAQLNRTSVVSYDTRDGDGADAAVAPDDYTARSGNVTFKPGQTVKIIRVNVVADGLHEGGATTSELMKLRLTGATDARIPDTVAEGEIVDDDRRPRISISDAYVVEGDAGVSVLRFTVRLTNPSEETVSVDYATADGTATAGTDYTAKSGTLTFSPGQSLLTIDVNVLNNLGSQGHRNFDLVLSDAVEAAITDDRATGTIIDDESTPVLLLDDVSVKERDSGLRIRRLTVRLSHAGASTATVAFGTTGGTAKITSDYAGTGGTLTFAAGVTTASLRIGVVGDTVKEPSEYFELVFGNAINLQLLDTRLRVTIIDND